MFDGGVALILLYSSSLDQTEAKQPASLSLSLELQVLEKDTMSGCFCFHHPPLMTHHITSKQAGNYELFSSSTLNI